MASHEQYSEDPLDIKKLVVIRAVNKRRSPKFNTFVHDYVISFNVNLLHAIEDLGDIFELLYQTFEYIFELLLADFSPTDHIRIVIENDTLETPIVIPYLPVSNVTLDMVFDAIADVLNSQDEFDITEGFRIHVSRAVLPSGTGRYARSRVIGFQSWLERKRSTIIKVSNMDNLCLARAIVIALEEKECKLVPKNRFGRFVKSVGPGSRQTTTALQLHAAAALPSNKPTYTLVDVMAFQTTCEYTIHIYDQFVTQIFSGSTTQNTKRHIYMLLFNQHYSVIRNMASFMGRRHFCDICENGFDSSIHRCKSTLCNLCNNIRCNNSINVISAGKVTCAKCGKQFYSAFCIGAYTCIISKKCDKCDKFYPKGQKKKHTKICCKFRCSVCNAYFSFPREDHFCFVQRLATESGSESDGSTSESNDNSVKMAGDVLFWYDFETTFVDDGFHKPTLLVCVSQHKTFVFKGESLMSDFFEMISSQLKRTSARLVFSAHNAAGFDGLLILRGLYDQGLTPKIFYRGSKILMLEISRRIRFICSYQFLPFSLRVLAKNFNLSIRKLYFPYLLDQQSYTETEIDFPKEDLFNPMSLRPHEYQQFKQAYQAMKDEYEQGGKRYNISEQLEKYCIADTVVLREVCLTFSREFEAMTGLKPFSTGITLPSVCLTLYRQQHLPSSSMLPVFPHDGIVTSTKHSKICSLWLQWQSMSDGIYIEGAHNVGEQVIGNYRVGGFYRHSTSSLCIVFEFYGCAYHSCEKHYPDPNAMNQLTKASHAQMRFKNRQKRQFLKSTYYQLVEKWECDFMQEVAGNNALRDFARSMGIANMNRLIPRDGLYGGRVEAFKLFAERTESLTINYYDFVSLYPTVMISSNYSVGRPTIIYGFTLGPVNTIDFHAYRGLLYIKILPPSDLLLPVLPFRTKDHGLTFPLCASCAMVCQHTVCLHTVEEKALVGVWSHVEIQVALEENYEILEVYEIYHFEDQSNDVFKTYVQTFMAAKIANSGFHPDITDEPGRQAFVDNLYTTTGIQLQVNSIVKNPVRKAIAKLCLNRGKFSQKTLQKTTKIMSDPSEFYRLHGNPSVQIDDFFNINDELLHVTYSDREDTRTRGKTCVMIAIETTAFARVRLYKLLKTIGAHRLIYTDTDSVVFQSLAGDWMPETGSFFGQLQDEISGKFGNAHINRIVSLGCKTYSMEIITAKNERHCETRCKGISLNVRTMRAINFDSMLNLLKNDVKGSLYMEEPHFIKRLKREARLSSTYHRKKLRFTFRKRIVNFVTFTTVPLGYV